MSAILSHPELDSGLSRRTKITRGHSCVLCRRRKIKCDGQRPCQNCQKSRAECVESDIVPAGRKKRRQVDLVARLSRAEEALRKAGLKIEDGDECYGVAEETDSSRAAQNGNQNAVGRGRTIEGGRLVIERGESRYVETSIWGDISAEVREDSIHLLQDSSDDESTNDISPTSDYCSLLFGRLMINKSLTSLHPPTVQIFRLWQAFLNNVNPLTKILHAPTTQELLLRAMEDLATVPAPTEALMFAIYYSAVISIDSGSCQSILGESRDIALAKYSTATQQALLNAKLLRTSNLMVLQALVLYLLSIRPSTDHDTLWILSGIATKIGQRIGLHQDSTSSSLSVLENELRGRIWWQIVAMEGHSSFFSGSATPMSVLAHNPRRLLNVNDSDLSPSMLEPPREQSAVTEMLFCSINYRLGRFMYQHIFEGGLPAGPDQGDRLALKLKAADDFENMLDQTYLRYCDPSVPLHYLAIRVVRASLSKMRLRLYAPTRSLNGSPQPQANSDAAFAISLKMLEIDMEGHSSAGQAKLKGFMWHIRVFFQLEAFIYALSELRIRTFGPQVDWAWQLIEAMYQNHGNILRETKNRLWFAAGNLCLKAWEQRVKSLQSQEGTLGFTVPPFVKELCAQRGIESEPVRAGGNHDSSLGFYDSMGLSSIPAIDTQWEGMKIDDTNVPLDTVNMGAAVDWEYWQTLFDDCGVPAYT
ncbi:Aurofusarin cluster transcription factor aurR2 [Lachnellula suecica]|uniref:Aurofusarin cluster transcription factor aurR2 n=1 Tax=Lachnellula suecica TaxID=602035 RepID=A0A8T9C437_9HELO|nr:Aurofusarin cluster transcription factor aurR2 [Lachnellula suecica]